MENRPDRKPHLCAVHCQTLKYKRTKIKYFIFLKKLVEVNKSEVSYSMNELETTQLIKMDKALMQKNQSKILEVYLWGAGTYEL